MKENTDFVNFGTYVNYEADMLKQEFDKVGIAVKTLYPGTPFGKESTGGAGWTAYTLLIRECDIEKAQGIKEGLGIEVAGTIPMAPYSRSIGKPRTVKFFTWTGIIFLLAGMALSVFHNADIILAICVIMSILSFTINAFLIIIPKKQKNESTDEQKDSINRG
jgi:hypothetical protein